MTIPFAASHQCPICRSNLHEDGDALHCRTCGKNAAWDSSRRRLDLTAFLDASMSVDREKVGLAYRVYSWFYAPLALLNMICVWRGSLGRLIGHYRRALAETRGKMILDVAIGDGALTRLACRTLPAVPRAIGLDISNDMLVQAEQNLKGFPEYAFYLADATAIPLADESMPAVLCFGGLHVIAHPRRALTEMVRVLAPDGVFYASILTDPKRPVSRHLAEEYVRLGFLSSNFSRREALNLISESGLKMTHVVDNGRMLLLRAVKAAVRENSPTLPPVNPG